MPRYTKNINTIYISERMQESLWHIGKSVVTAIVAPMGYGKTTAALWYLEERRNKGDSVFRVNIYSSDVNLFWQSFRAAFRGTELEQRLDGMSFPVGQIAIHMLIADITDYLNTLEKELFLLIDDCHLMDDNRVLDMLFSLCDIPSDKFHLIIASRSFVFARGEELHLGSRLYRITADDMRLNRTELSAYLRRCGVELTDENFEILFKNSEGWFSCIYLNIRNYEKYGTLLSKGEDIYSMIGETLYAGYNKAEQSFLIDMSLADEFSIEQAEFICEDENVCEIINKLAQNNAFIRYLPDTNTYRFHHMLRRFAEQVFCKLPKDKKNFLRLRYGEWHESQGQFVRALRFYGDADATLSVLRVIGLDRGVQLASIQPEWILALLDRCSEAELISEPQALLVLMRRLFSWRRIPKMLELKELVFKVADMPSLTEKERYNLLGECDLIMSFLKYNEIAAMSALHQKAAALMTEKAVSIGNTGSYTFGSPSVLMMFHRESGSLLNEVEIMNCAMPFYYRITDHHGMGAELIMEAEALYNRGEFIDAKIMLNRAKDASKSERQLYIPLCCDFLERRLSLFGEADADDEWYMRKSDDFIKTNDTMIFSTLDACTAYLSAITHKTDATPEWLANGELDEANLLSPARPMFEIIYNQVLLASKDYITVVARREKLLEMCKAFPYLLCEIHLHIQLAVANEKLGKAETARDEIKSAFELALPDGIILPFAENIGISDRLLDSFGQTPEIDMIRQLQKKLSARCVGTTQSLESLTERERSVAHLYANGKTRKQIADELYLSEGTVKNYINAVYGKLGIEGSPKQKQHALSALISKNR